MLISVVQRLPVSSVVLFSFTQSPSLLSQPPLYVVLINYSRNYSSNPIDRHVVMELFEVNSHAFIIHRRNGLFTQGCYLGPTWSKLVPYLTLQCSLVETRDGRFGYKVSQIGPKWDKFGAFSDQLSVHLAPMRHLGPI